MDKDQQADCSICWTCRIHTSSCERSYRLLPQSDRFLDSAPAACAAASLQLHQHAYVFPLGKAADACCGP